MMAKTALLPVVAAPARGHIVTMEMDYAYKTSPVPQQQLIYLSHRRSLLSIQMAHPRRHRQVNTSIWVKIYLPQSRGVPHRFMPSTTCPCGPPWMEAAI